MPQVFAEKCDRCGKMIKSTDQFSLMSEMAKHSREHTGMPNIKISKLQVVVLPPPIKEVIRKNREY